MFLTAALVVLSLSVTHSFECTSTTTSTTTLKCDLKTLQSRFDSSQLSSAKRLEIRCSDLFIFESQLSSEHFGKLPDLEELSIESCKIRHIPARAFAGLNSLKKLRLQSYSSLVLDIDVESFKKANVLEDIDLTHNNIWSLPSGMLCEMSNLRRLNLSDNHLMEPSDLGIASCRIALLFLDVSQNYLTSITKEDLSQMPALERLNLSFNQISSISENAFFGVEHLKVIDLSHNQISALPSGLFNKSSSLERLLLQNNSLSMIHPDLLVGLTNLQVLNLSGNAISSQLISRETFSSLASLNTLDLSFNQLSKLGEDIFTSLTSLQRLYLQNNFIVKIDGGNVFANQVQLKVIDLSRNKMSAVNDKLFSSLTNLVTLRMEENRFQDLNNLTFKCNNVLELSFQQNLLTSVPSFFANCQSVKRLDLSDNKIISINNKTFSRLVNLIELNLSGNQLSRLENLTFSFDGNSSSSIEILNLSKNKLSVVEQSAFHGLNNLNVLSLNENFLSDLNGILSHLGNLELLNVSSNKVEWFDFAFLPNSLSW
jgi:Leucine-rich repeat (LRR) protein